MACDCDGDDLWRDWPFNLDCTHECEEEDDDLCLDDDAWSREATMTTTWLCRDAETDAEDDWTEVDASVDTAEEAACQFAIEADHMSGASCYHRLVAVKRSEESETETYEVEMELRPTYTAWPCVPLEAAGRAGG